MERRKFIRKSVVTAAGIGLASGIPGIINASYARKIPPSDKLRAGLIGCNGMGFADITSFLMVPGTECAAICDVDENVIKRRLKDIEEKQGKKPKVFGDYRKMLEDKDLDVIIIGTPDHWHCLPTVHACEAGKDVYVEKPLANSIGECTVMAQAAKKYNRIVTVGMQQRSGKHWKEAMELIHAGNLGRIRKISIWGHWGTSNVVTAVPDEPVPAGVDYDMWLGPAPARPFNKYRFHGSWRGFWDYGGGLQTDWGVHLIDMGLWANKVTSPPKSVKAWGGRYNTPGSFNETADTQTVIYDMGDYCLTWEHESGMNTGYWNRQYGVAIMGQKGTLVADRDSWEVFREGTDGKSDKASRFLPSAYAMEEVPKHESDYKDHPNNHENFVHCVKTREVPAASVEVGRLAAIYAHLGNIAYRSGRQLTWDGNTGKFVNDPDADRYLNPVYRAPWKFPMVS